MKYLDRGELMSREMHSQKMEFRGATNCNTILEYEKVEFLFEDTPTKRIKRNIPRKVEFFKETISIGYSHIEYKWKVKIHFTTRQKEITLLHVRKEKK